MNTRIIDGWHMIAIFGSLLPPSPTASGLLLNPPSIILLSLGKPGKPEPTNVNTASVYFTNQSEFAPNVTAIPHELPSHRTASRQKFVCHQWNQTSYEGCLFPNCQYEHICYYCANNPASWNCNHKAIFCLNTPARQPVPQQKPRPLLP